MKLIVFSDIHGNIFALREFVSKIENIEYDYLIFCGDIFGYYYNQKEVIQELSKLKKLIWIKGNHDQYFLDIYKRKVISVQEYINRYGHSYERINQRFNKHEVDIIAIHDTYYELETDKGMIGIFHGTPDNLLEGRLYPNNEIENPSLYQKYEMVILGHTHCRMERWVGNTLVVNSGSLGQPRDGNGYGYASIDTDTKKVLFCNVIYDEEVLYEQIDRYDPELKKLKEVLERKNAKDFSDGH